MYRVRVLSAIVTAQLIILAIIKFWPVQSSNKPMKAADFSEEPVFQEVIITRQPGTPPPPPKPSAPIPEPTDEIIEDEIPEIAEVEFSTNTDPLSTEKIAGSGAGDAAGAIVKNPQRPPQIVRIVEATTPDAAQRANIKAELTVRLLVGKDGMVEEVTIDEIRRYTGPESYDYKIVEDIDYGLIEATLDAARQWTFRPAKKNGQPVRAYTRQIFTFGF